MESVRNEKIKELAKAHLTEIANSETLRERIVKAVEADTLNAYWDLHTDLTNGSEYQKRLLDYKVHDREAINYTRELSAILRGERLEEN